MFSAMMAFKAALTFKFAGVLGDREGFAQENARGMWRWGFDIRI
jgi:hypothetical protein